MAAARDELQSGASSMDEANIDELLNELAADAPGDDSPSAAGHSRGAGRHAHKRKEPSPRPKEPDADAAKASEPPAPTSAAVPVTLTASLTKKRSDDSFTSDLIASAEGKKHEPPKPSGRLEVPPASGRPMSESSEDSMALPKSLQATAGTAIAREESDDEDEDLQRWRQVAQEATQRTEPPTVPQPPAQRIEVSAGHMAVRQEAPSPASGKGGSGPPTGRKAEPSQPISRRRSSDAMAGVQRGQQSGGAGKEKEKEDTAAPKKRLHIVPKGMGEGPPPTPPPASATAEEADTSPAPAPSPAPADAHSAQPAVAKQEEEPLPAIAAISADRGAEFIPPSGSLPPHLRDFDRVTQQVIASVLSDPMMREGGEGDNDASTADVVAEGSPARCVMKLRRALMAYQELLEAAHRSISHLQSTVADQHRQLCAAGRKVDRLTALLDREQHAGEGVRGERERLMKETDDMRRRLEEYEKGRVERERGDQEKDKLIEALRGRLSDHEKTIAILRKEQHSAVNELQLRQDEISRLMRQFADTKKEAIDLSQELSVMRSQYGPPLRPPSPSPSPSPPQGDMDVTQYCGPIPEGAEELAAEVATLRACLALKDMDLDAAYQRCGVYEERMADYRTALGEIEPSHPLLTDDLQARQVLREPVSSGDGLGGAGAIVDRSMGVPELPEDEHDGGRQQQLDRRESMPWETLVRSLLSWAEVHQSMAQLKDEIRRLHDRQQRQAQMLSKIQPYLPGNKSQAATAQKDADVSTQLSELRGALREKSVAMEEAEQRVEAAAFLATKEDLQEARLEVERLMPTLPPAILRLMQPKLHTIMQNKSYARG